MAEHDGPLDDMPDSMIEKRAAARRGEVLERAPMADTLDEGPSDDDLDRFGSVTQTCWRCGTELYDDATVCWNCQASVGPGSGPRQGTPVWVIIVGVVLALVIAAWAIF
ncbi:MAG: hypothetical protein RIB58_00390 [Phycisphaerales bacterium]|jgi:hypothetical protein